ncbi:unnamed protein product [Acanthoscelides obtectus]|uniref:Uncharacterized protein n=1 Tax=Acanthoscelides obtectus TaxID=200917 RepID=A0A9P0MDP1_ACAOB|nr:unnamed protein product [Acanthoscelides obtectus]CAH2014111.1 unnamed protein product [Acanthoscelides obtectus]CAK1648790.1 hypothetical protein AOBTE_LOCUS15877 [Acanthoscelides obtectus]CAK1649222.1 hypothetical protein AOBTE_LOCUS16101 [Acanthoscelides obtectus]
MQSFMGFDVKKYLKFRKSFKIAMHIIVYASYQLLDPLLYFFIVFFNFFCLPQTFQKITRNMTSNKVFTKSLNLFKNH